MSENSRLQINWISSAGSALGAVSAAVVLSTFGVAGTLIGAAIGSLCISVGGALYAHSLTRTKERMELARLASVRARARAHGDPVADPTPIQRSEPVPDSGSSLGTDPRGEMLRDLPWKRIAAVTVALFALAMTLIVAFELTVGRPVSTFTGGRDSDQRTSIPGLGGSGHDSGKDDPSPVPEPPGESEPPATEEPVPTPVPPETDVPPEEIPTTPVPTEVPPVEPTPTPEPTEPTPTTTP